jgi:hypothetical protein
MNGFRTAPVYVVLLSAAIVVVAGAAPAANLDAGSPTPPTVADAGAAQPTADRVASCTAVADALCKTHVACNRACRTCEMLHSSYETCMPAELSGCNQQHERPLRAVVAAADFKRCLTAVRGIAKTPKDRASVGVCGVLCRGSRS